MNNRFNPRGPFVVAAFILMAALAHAGHVDLSGGISLFTPPDPGADVTPLYKADVAYWFNPRANVNAEVAYARYKISGVQYNYLPNKLRVEGHPRAGRLVDPYFGAGLLYAKKKVGPGGWGTKFGYTALMGFNLLVLSRTTVGAQAEYVVPDWRFTRGYWEYGFNFGGITF